MLLERIILLLICIALQHLTWPAINLVPPDYRIAATIRSRADKPDKARETSLRKIYIVVNGIA
jgi:hypothetical protein